MSSPSLHPRGALIPGAGALLHGARCATGTFRAASASFCLPYAHASLLVNNKSEVLPSMCSYLLPRRIAWIFDALTVNMSNAESCCKLIDPLTRLVPLAVPSKGSAPFLASSPLCFFLPPPPACFAC